MNDSSAISFPPCCQHGSRVRVTEGPLAGIEGMFLRDKSKGRLIVSINVLQTSVAVEMDGTKVERCRH